MMRKFFVITTALLLLLIPQLTAQGNETVTARVEDGKILITYHIPEGYHQTLQKDYFYVEVESYPGLQVSETIYPEGHLDADGNTEYKGNTTLVKEFTISNDFKAGSIKIYAGYQFCEDDGTCLFPEEKEFNLFLTSDATSREQTTSNTEPPIKQSSKQDLSFDEIKEKLSDFEIANTAVGYLKSEEFIDFVKKAETAEGSSGNRFLGLNIWYVLLLIIIGGIALNLTPCVLPMVPVTVGIIGAGTQAESKHKGFLIGGIYGIGMMLAYGTLGLIVVLTGSRFGAINSSPWFNLIIAIIFILLSLAMFDIIPIDFSRYQSNSIVQKRSRGKYITIFILGVIAAILAGACVAPVLISVILYSVTLYSAGNHAALLLPFLLGFGMALPWPFVGAGISILPRPGNWMKWVKVIFGVIILVIALYYGYTAIHLFSETQAETQEVGKPVDISKLNWNNSILDGLKKAKEDNKPVLIDFWATWCKNCLAMDKTTFKDEAVKEALDQHILIKYQAENLDSYPTKDILNYFNVLGLPTYIILNPKIDNDRME
ncbi:MAG: cytochrome c biogenesis protein CcdA [Candidatus Cloacimonadota bacterium]|nr:cytochrome c biogenesis protein CcdA [Candidatus Cloacimonadota bacterium]